MKSKARLLALTSATCLLLLTTAPVLAAAPANDDVASPIVIDSVPYTNSQDTTEATTGASDPDCYGTGPTVWYQHTASEDGRLELNTFGSNYDTTLYVVREDGEGGLDVLACNDDAGGSVQSRIRFDARGGETYLFMVGAYDGGEGGELVLNLDVAQPAVLFEVSITVDGTGKFTRDGRAIITGTATCSADAYIELEALITQQVGRFSIDGWAYTELSCSPEGSAWQLHTWSHSGRFGGGPASVRLEAWYCGDEECAYDQIEATVRLRH